LKTPVLPKEREGERERQRKREKKSEHLFSLQGDLCFASEFILDR
jgi:hypothetical protein